MNPFIQFINAVHFKGQTFQQPLTRLTVISGSNARGKSSRIEAVTLGELHYLPGLSKKPNDIFDALASGNPIAVENEHSDGRKVGGVWEEKRGSIKFTEIGAGTMPPESLDASLFLAMTGPARTAYLFSRAKLPDSFKIPALVATICANVKSINLDENTAETESVLSGIVTDISNAGKSAGQSPQEFIASLAADMKERLRLANENARRMAATVAGLVQIKEQGNGAGDIEARLAAARKELDAANSEVARLKQVGVQLKSEIAHNEGLSAKAVNPVPVPEPGPKPSPAAMTLPRPMDSEVGAAFVSAAMEAQKIIMAVAALTDEVQQCEASIAAAKKNTTCPTCGHDITDKQKKVVADLKKELASLNKKLKAAVADQEAKLAAKTKASEAFKSKQIEISAWDKAEKELRDTNQFVLDSWNSRVAAFNNYQAGLNHDDAGNRAAAALPELRQKIEQARSDYNAALQIASQKQSVVAYLQMEYNKLILQRSESASRAKSLAEAEKFKAEALVLKQVCNLIDDLQKEVIAQTIKPLVDSCNELCADILVAPIAFQDGEIGMMGATGFYGNKTMSDSQRLMLFAALAIALASEAPFRLCILGRFEALDYNAKPKVIRRVLQLIRDGKIDQCICVEVAGQPNPELAYEEFKANPDFSITVLN